VFFMTDNLVSYYIINGGSSRVLSLHELVMEIKALELELGFHLEVVHVPGTLMIDQGTDGLSRGLWLAQERHPDGINQRLFNNVPATEGLLKWAMAEAGFAGHPFEYEDFLTTFSMSTISHRFTVWTPVPEGARQVIVSFLQRWVQSAQDTGAIFLVPRILQREWGRVCRYVEEIGVYQASKLPLGARFHSDLPFVLLCIRPHTLTLCKYSRMEPFAIPKGGQWHKEQADEVRRLS
jgi:hypothetical protein